MFQRCHRLKTKLVALTAAGCLFGLPAACNLGTFAASQTISLDGRQVITQLLINAIVGPIQAIVTDRVNSFFDQFEDNNA